MMVRIVVVLPAPFRPSSTVTASTGRAGHALQDVVLADIRVDVLDLEQVSRHAPRLRSRRLDGGIAAHRLGDPSAMSRPSLSTAIESDRAITMSILCSTSRMVLSRRFLMPRRGR